LHSARIMSFRLRHLLPILLLAGCTAASAGDSTIAGTSWRFTKIDGDRPASSRALLAFERKQIDATVGCNRMGGPWRMADGRLIAGPLVQTEMYCDGALGAQEQATGALLAGAPLLTIEGDRLTLTAAGHSAELVRVE
jgi:heat shock protein HslJ